jgi:hypothetical protein
VLQKFEIEEAIKENVFGGIEVYVIFFPLMPGKKLR